MLLPATLTVGLLFANEGAGSSLGRAPANLQAPGPSTGDEAGNPRDCGCVSGLMARIAQAAAPGDSTPTQRQPTRNNLQDRIRQVGELIAAGRIGQARQLVRDAIVECESSEADIGECSHWARSLRGLDLALKKTPDRNAITNSIGMKLVHIPAGEFMMGSLKGEIDWLRLTFRKTWREGHKQWFQDELPLHPVRITRSFYMGATEVTVGQFREFVKATKHKTDAETGDGGMVFSKTENRWTPEKGMKWDSVSWKISEDQPVVFVSWNDAKAFCRWLSRREKKTYRLPTEAEWEMACRGGSVWTRYPWGNRLPGDRDTNFGDGNAKLPGNLATVDDGYRFVAPVGSYRPNGFGLHDMDGNVMEWVEDYYDRNYYESSPVDDPQGPSVGQSRVNRGGNWFASPSDGRCAFRGFSSANMSFWNLGFRVIMEDTDEERQTVASANPDSVRMSGQSGHTGAELPPADDEGIRFFRQAMYGAQQQQWDEAVDNLEKALKVYEQREDHKWIARVKATLAGIYAERNRTYKSKELYTQALAGFRKIGDLTNARIVLNQLQELETAPVVKVAEVKKGGPADRAGIVAGDIVIEYAGETGFRLQGFKKLVHDYSRSEKVTLSVLNNEEISTLVVPGGELGIAVEEVKRPPRPRRPQEDRDQQERRRPQRRPPAARR